MAKCCDDGGCGEIPALTTGLIPTTLNTTTTSSPTPITPITPATPATTGTGGAARGGTTERRACRRTRVHGDALIAFDTEQGGTAPQRVAFIDASVGGIGIRAGGPVKIGTRFALFPDKVRQSSWTGEVVRCVQNEGGWTIGLQLAELAA